METPINSSNQTSDNHVILSHSFDWIVDDKGNTDDDSMEIRAWTLDRENSTHLIRIQGFPCFARFELPRLVDQRIFHWREDHMSNIINYIDWCLRKMNKVPPIGHKFLMAEKLYYYRQDQKFPFLQLYFINTESMNACINLLKKPRNIREIGLVNFKVWENNISVVRKFLTVKNAHYSQWFSIVARKVPDGERISTIENEYYGRWDTYTEIPQDQTSSWFTLPKILAFDIESYSDNHRCFPNMNHASDVAYMISVVVQTDKKPETRKNYCISTVITRDKSGLINIYAKGEVAMIRAFEEVIVKEDPDIVIGYNINGFDIPYLDARLKMRGQTWGCIGRIRNKDSYVENISWQSGAYGKNDMYILKMEGRISVDLLPVIKRGYKFRNYRLDTVANYFLGRGKHDVSAQDMFKYYHRLERATKAYAKYISELPSVIKYIDENDIEYTEYLNQLTNNDTYPESLFDTISEDITSVHQDLRPYFEDSDLLKGLSHLADSLHNDSLIGEIKSIPEKINAETCISTHPSLMSALEKCPSKDGYIRDEIINFWIRIQDLIRIGVDELLLIHRCKLIVLYHTAINDMTRVRNYAEEDSALCVDIFGKIETWIELIMMSVETEVLPSEFFTRGQQIRVISKIYDKCFKLGIVMNEEDTADYGHMKGGHVEEPIKGVHDDVLYLDFGSMYPSIMDAENMCYTTFIPPEYDSIIPDEMCNIIEDNIEMSDGTFKYVKARFIKKEYKVGVLPTIVRELVTKRREVRKRGYASKDPTQQLVLDKQQLALKVAGNSVFGFTSRAKGSGKYIFGLLGRMVTARGRQMIKRSRDYVVNNYGGVTVYGDTDSTLQKLPGVPSEKIYEIGEKIASELSDMFPKPHVMELENVVRIFCIKPKMYMYFQVNKDGTVTEDPEKVNSKGVLTARRDNCIWQRKCYGDCSYAILCKKSLMEVYAIMLEHIIQLFSHAVPWEDLLLTKGVGASYKSDTATMKVFSDELRAIGKPVAPGERLDYLVVRTDNPNHKLGHRMRLPETYLERLNTDNPEFIDYEYYVKNLMVNRLEKMLMAQFGKEIEEMESKRLPLKRGRFFTRINEHPVKMTLGIVNAKKKYIDDIKHIESYVEYFKQMKANPRNRYGVPKRLVPPKTNNLPKFNIITNATTGLPKFRIVN